MGCLILWFGPGVYILQENDQGINDHSHGKRHIIKTMALGLVRIQFL
jgi:hypothetical protein